MVVWLTGPRRLWVVLGSFTPCLYSGILISLLFGLNGFANSTLGSRDHIHPEICIMPFLNWEPGSASLCPWAAEILLSRAPCVVPCRFLALVVFSDDDVAFAMSRYCILPSRACVTPSMSMMILLTELLLRTCIWLYICIYMSLMTNALYIPRLCSLFKLHHE